MWRKLCHHHAEQSYSWKSRFSNLSVRNKRSLCAARALWLLNWKRHNQKFEEHGWHAHKKWQLWFQWCCLSSKRAQKQSPWSGVFPTRYMHTEKTALFLKLENKWPITASIDSLGKMMHRTCLMWTNLSLNHSQNWMMDTHLVRVTFSETQILVSHWSQVSENFRFYQLLWSLLRERT